MRSQALSIRFAQSWPKAKVVRSSIRHIVCGLLFGVVVSAQPAVVGGGYAAPPTIKVAPGQLVTIFATGVGAGLSSRVAATSLPLPYSLAGISVTIQELSNPPLPPAPLPLLAVGKIAGLTAISVQMPFLLRTSSFISPLIPPPATLTIHENGVAAVTITVAPVPTQVHIATTCDANLTNPPAGAPCRPLFVHGDGSLVTRENPARAGEPLAVYAFGLGVTNPGMVEGHAATTSQPAALPTLSAEAAIKTIPSERRIFAPSFAGLTPGFAGLYQINFTAPTPPLPFGPGDCNTLDSPNGNVAVTVLGNLSSDTAALCIMP